MDTIKFSIEEYVDEEFGFHFPTINIYINGINLLDMVRQVEHDFRNPLEGGKLSRQSYVGLCPDYRQDFADEFLGRTNRHVSTLLTCTCMEELCNSIVAKITLDSSMVVWSEIRNPFLSVKSGLWKTIDGAEYAVGYPIDYSELGPFVFDRHQYLEALEQLVSGK